MPLVQHQDLETWQKMKFQLTCAALTGLVMRGLSVNEAATESVKIARRTFQAFVAAESE